MSVQRIATEGLLILPHLRIQNANAISSPLTYGFPSMTAFAGFMWALERELTAANLDLGLDAVGVICHAFQAQTEKGYVNTFRLTRNPVNEKGETAAIVEEGRMHMDITLVFSAFWNNDSTRSVFLKETETEVRQVVEKHIAQQVCTMRVAGGSIISKYPAAQLLPIPEDNEERAKNFRQWRRKWIPGFALVGRDDLLRNRWEQLQRENPQANVLDAWMDLSRRNRRSEQQPDGTIKWLSDRTEGSGWRVPIPVGYGALSPLHAAGTVRNARDMAIPFRFVESLHSMGQWISPHRLNDIDQLLWKTDTQPASGLYRLRNHYSPTPESA